MCSECVFTIVLTIKYEKYIESILLSSYHMFPQTGP